MYLFDTHYGTSTIADDETGLVLEWENGNFNETQKISVDQATIAVLIPEGETAESFIAKKLREMGEYVLENYPELV